MRRATSSAAHPRRRRTRGRSWSPRSCHSRPGSSGSGQCGGGSSTAGRRRATSPRPVRRSSSRHGPGWATTGAPWRCGTRARRSSRSTEAGCRDRRCPGGALGIGPYTARAVAAAAFGVPVAPLDVNVRRVVSRVIGVPSSLRRASRLPPTTWSLAGARTLVRCRDGPRVGDLPAARAPCDACPLAPVCASRGAVVAVERTAAGVAVPVHHRAGFEDGWSRRPPPAPDGAGFRCRTALGVHDATLHARRQGPRT